MQRDLLSKSQQLNLPGGGELLLYRGWFDPQRSERAFDYLLKETPWEQPEIVVAGRKLPTPRLQAWYGEDHAEFTYSGARFTPLRPTKAINKLMHEVASVANYGFNSVLINQYRNEHDSVGWHADDEPEFGENPVIASLSFGAQRRFCFKPKPNHAKLANWKKGQRSIVVQLHAGDLLIMSRDVQNLWQHCVPKESTACAARINLTFRKVCIRESI